MPKISIVTPCVNQAATLERTIQSVLQQDYADLEYVIIDGGSTDGTAEILDKYASQLHFYCSEPDGGQYEAINKGFGHCTGEIMGWLNGDDFYLPGALRAVAGIFSALPEVEWLTSMSQITADANGSCIECNAVPGFSREAFLDGLYLPDGGDVFLSFVQQESTFWRRSLWERAGPIDTEYRLAGDFDLWCRFVRKVSTLYCTPSPLACFRYLDGQRSGFQRDGYLDEARQALEHLRRDLQWRRSPFRRAAAALQLHRVPYLPFLPHTLYRILQSFYQYTAKTVIRRKRGSIGDHWEVRPVRFLRWRFSEWAPHFAD